VATPAYEKLAHRIELDLELVRRVANGARPQIAMTDTGEGPAPGPTTPVVLAAARHAVQWRLPDAVRRAALAQPASVVVVTGSAEAAQAPLEAACEAFGLTAAQTRVALTLIRSGDVPSVARALGLSPHTVRESLEAVKARLGAPRLPALVLKLASQGFGLLPGDADAEALTDIWGLSARQAAVASLVASGLTRRDAAAALKISEAVIKKDLDQAFQILGVGTAAALGRRLAEVRSMAWLMRTTAGEVGFLDPVAEPLRFVLRPDGTRIAVSDYGPSAGRPVIVSHTSLTTRPVPRTLLRRLHVAGYRPIALDRPGFGMTDAIPEGGDQFRTAALDAMQVLDRLRISKADIVCRGAAGFALALLDLAPERLGTVVLVNPGLAAAFDRRRTGFWGVLKSAYRRNPRIIRLWVTHLSRQITPERHQALMRRWLAGSPADEAAAADPAIARDYFLAQRMFATGRIAGYVAEQAAYLARAQPTPRPDAHDWRVLIGTQDTLHDPEDVLGYWREILPHAQFRTTPEAGRLLALTHPDLVVAALERNGGFSV
jgi:pimeloyl-ACP methyl ester carboxylesterase/DNA-binding CsgD family transcriptional regulator